MDQDNTKGQDKRNWRERLGVGAAGNKDLPKISDDYRKDAAPMAARPIGAAKVAPRPAIAASGVKPAPMAPRANPKPIPPISPEKLAERLRSQRDASARMAEQRVQVARQRTESAAPVLQQRAPLPTPPPAVTAQKPKFTFAEEGQQKAAAKPPVIQRPAAPQIAPARPPLGGPPQPAFTPRPPQQQQFAPPPSYGQPQQPQSYNQGYGQPPVPPYRPIDPATGYAPPPQYTNPPPRNFNTAPAGYVPPGAGPRLNVPARPVAGAAYGNQPSYGAEPRLPRTAARPTAPQLSDDQDYADDYYAEAPAQRGRRPSTTDYQQAYRDAEGGYEEDAPRSRTPWILASLLLLTLAVAGAGVWFYQKSFKPTLTGQNTTQEVPAVTAPETPAKVAPEQSTQAQTPATGSPSKKQIYDRIVGDQEILGGELAPVEEVPAQVPEPTPAAGSTPQPSTGEDAAPLPIPPPPPGTGDQQGSLKLDPEKQSAENITPAAGESQAAVAAPGGVPEAPQQDALNSPPAPIAPAPGEQPPAQVASSDAGTETIAEPAPVVKKKVVTPPKKKVVAEKAEGTKNLGAKPVVLVPPAKKAKAATSETLDETNVASVSDATDNGGLYGDADVTAPVAATKPTVAPQTEAKKKKTLADLFKGDTNEPTDLAANDVAASEPVAPAVKPVAPKKATAPVAPAPQQQAALGNGGYVVQLASFRSRNEATAEYGRLKSKNSAALSGLSPIVSEATVGGSTRYRLSVGTMANREQANAVCSKLFAGGERDCLVKKQ
jgi:cell division protein FtsN